MANSRLGEFAGTAYTRHFKRWRRLPIHVVLLLLFVPVAVAPAAAETMPVFGGYLQPGPDADGASSFRGWVDSPRGLVPVSSGFHVTGWVVDTAALAGTGVVDVQIFQGVMGSGGTLLAQAATSLQRPDVAAALNNSAYAAAGYDARIPAGVLGLGSTLLTINVHTSNRGWWYRSLEVTMARSTYALDPINQLTSPVVGERVSNQTDYLVTGYAFDRNSPGLGINRLGVDRVQLFLDGDRHSGTPLGDAQLGAFTLAPSANGPQFKQAGFSLKLFPGKYSNGIHTLFSYARSAGSGEEAVTSVPFNITDGT